MYTGNAMQQTWKDVVNFLAGELCLGNADIHDDDEFSELGVDAILARSIASGLSKLLSIEVSDAVFQNCTNVGAFRRYLSEQLSTAHGEKPKPMDKKASLKPKPKGRSKVPLSMVLQGTPASTIETIFLLPDGSGSGMAYAGIPRIAPTTCVIGLNSPFLGRAKEYKCSIEETASVWLPEIRARQPHGPYILGGWSAGGYYSFEVAKQLIAQGETVSKIILLDSPCRLNFEALPMEVVRYLSTTGRMGDWGSGPDTAPDWVTAHFEGTLAAVRKYMPTPLRVPAGLPVPQVFIIWCREGVWNTDSDEEAYASGLDLSVKVTRFLLEGKPHLSTHGWEKLFPGADVLVSSMPGNHFTLINQPFVRSLAPLMRTAVEARGQRETTRTWQRV